MWEQIGTVPDGATLRWIEAEDGLVTAPLRRVARADASGGRAVEVPPGLDSLTAPPAAGGALYGFTVPRAGRYRIWARVLAPQPQPPPADPGADSFWVRVDRGPFIQWNELPVRPGWLWDDVHRLDGRQGAELFSLSAGQHTVEFRHRKAHAKLDKLLITDAPSFVPSDEGG
jgi:hypothetical protein